MRIDFTNRETLETLASACDDAVEHIAEVIQYAAKDYSEEELEAMEARQEKYKELSVALEEKARNTR